MIYTKLTKTAIKICFLAHKDQLDKSGLPYVLHPLHVAESMTDEYSTAAALLHDVVEDSDITLDNLSSNGIPKNVIDALRLLTHDSSIPYLEYIRALKSNDIARAVKLADLAHNIDLTRLDEITPEDIRRKEKYMKAIEILKS